jgi:hypothetical protein
MTVAISAFDYSALPADVAGEARGVASDFWALQKRTVEGMAEVGRKIIAIRDRLEHGQFLKWVEAELGSKSSAYRCIAVAEKFEPAILPTLGSLDLTTIYQLAANTTPGDVRQEVVERLARGETLPTLAVQQIVSRGRALARQERALARVDKKKLAARRRREARRNREDERLKQEWQTEIARLKTVARQAADLIASRLSVDELRLLVCQVEEVHGSWFLEALKERPELAKQIPDSELRWLPSMSGVR